MNNKKFIMALDAGTSSSRAIVFDRERRIVAVAQREFRQIYPQPGWVEHDPVEIWDTQLAVAREAMAKAGATASSLAAIGITNQRETTVVWDRETGRPVIVTQNGRTAGVFVNASTWDEIQEKLDKLETYEDLLVAEGEADRDEVYTAEEVERMMEKHIAKHAAKKKKVAV